MEKCHFFLTAPGSILNIQIHSDRSQYELCEVSFNETDHIHIYGAAKVNIIFTLGFSGFGFRICV